ncbi:MAG: serine palmitoyltransferase [Gammaproteobacteria bacterium]
MSLFEKFSQARALEQALMEMPINPTGTIISEVVSASEAIIDGQLKIMAGTNNYLGLTFDADCVAAGQQALLEAGTGTTGSRMANGTYQQHLDLETEIAEFFDFSHGMVFSTGYSANIGMLTALLNTEDSVLIDSEGHASLFDGCRMSGAKIYRFKHNDPEGLRKRLSRLGEAGKDALIVVEGLYSVRGDCAPLKEYVDVKNEFGSYLMVDEAHSLGLYGENGRGLAEDQGVSDEVDFVVGTFSKSLGSIGGFCVSNHPELSLIRYASRPYIFTASPSPSVIATTRQALKKIKNCPELREIVWSNAQLLHSGLSQLGFQIGADVSPVIGIPFEDREVALTYWQDLFNKGVYTNLILPPAAPDGGSLIRCSVTAAHSKEQIRVILDAFDAIKNG